MEVTIMKFKIDHDYHIHSQLSTCSRGDPEQTPERILRYAKENGLSRICITDHYWDSAVPGASRWYEPQNFDHIYQSVPLPQCDGVEFLFGCETDMDKNMNIGIPPSRYGDFDFIIIPTTHLHMKGFTIDECDTDDKNKIARLWVERFDAVLSADLPFHKVGIAHLTCGLMFRQSREGLLEIFDMIPTEELERLFSKAATLGCGIELNMGEFSDEESDTLLRIYRVAKACGCKFYLGSDAHHPEEFEKKLKFFEKIITLLDLKESDKFHIAI